MIVRIAWAGGLCGVLLVHASGAAAQTAPDRADLPFDACALLGTVRVPDLAGQLEEVLRLDDLVADDDATRGHRRP